MYSYLKGQLVTKVAESPKGAYFVVDVNGIGYEVLTSSRSVGSSPPPGETIQVFTTLVVREDAMFLVGFNTKEERDLFNILLNANGVGLKTALALLSSLSVSEIAQSVVSDNYKTLTTAKGVGPKLAQKMILDLREKMTSWRETAMIETEAVAEWGQFTATHFTEAESVLLSLGYSPEEVLRSFQAIHTTVDARETANSELVLKESLRWLALV